MTCWRSHLLLLVLLSEITWVYTQWLQISLRCVASHHAALHQPKLRFLPRSSLRGSCRGSSVSSCSFLVSSVSSSGGGQACLRSCETDGCGSKCPGVLTCWHLAGHADFTAFRQQSQAESYLIPWPHCFLSDPRSHLAYTKCRLACVYLYLLLQCMFSQNLFPSLQRILIWSEWEPNHMWIIQVGSVFQSSLICCALTQTDHFRKMYFKSQQSLKKKNKKSCTYSHAALEASHNLDKCNLWLKKKRLDKKTSWPWAQGGKNPWIDGWMDGYLDVARNRGPGQASNRRSPGLQGLPTNHLAKGVSSRPSGQGAWSDGVLWQDRQLSHLVIRSLQKFDRGTFLHLFIFFSFHLIHCPPILRNENCVCLLFPMLSLSFYDVFAHLCTRSLYIWRRLQKVWVSKRHHWFQTLFFFLAHIPC